MTKFACDLRQPIRGRPRLVKKREYSTPCRRSYSACLAKRKSRLHKEVIPRKFDRPQSLSATTPRIYNRMHILQPHEISLPRASNSRYVRSGPSATCSSVENISAFESVYRVAFSLTQNQTRYGAVSVQEELRCGACRLKLRLRLRN